MKKLIIIGFFCFLSTLVYADVHVQVNSSQIGIDDSLQLTLTQDNLQNGAFLISPLYKKIL